MSSLAVSKLKGLLQEQIAQRAAAGESGSSAAVIDAVRKANPEAIKAASLEMENAMMARYISQLAIKQPKHLDGAPDMFADYPGVHQFMRVQVQRDGTDGPEWQLIGKVTLGELGEWLGQDRRTKTTRRGREPGMAKLLRDLSDVAKGRKDITVEDAMKLRRARGGK